MNRDDRIRAAQKAVAAAEERGEVADSMKVRADIVARITAGTITLEQGQAELAAIKRSAKKRGLTTRARVYRGR